MELYRKDLKSFKDQPILFYKDLQELKDIIKPLYHDEKITICEEYLDLNKKMKNFINKKYSFSFSEHTPSTFLINDFICFIPNKDRLFNLGFHVEKDNFIIIKQLIDEQNKNPLKMSEKMHFSNGFNRLALNGFARTTIKNNMKTIGENYNNEILESLETIRHIKDFIISMRYEKVEIFDYLEKGKTYEFNELCEKLEDIANVFLITKDLDLTPILEKIKDKKDSTLNKKNII